MLFRSDAIREGAEEVMSDSFGDYFRDHIRDTSVSVSDISLSLDY